jgi:hypothetical protein
VPDLRADARLGCGVIAFVAMPLCLTAAKRIRCAIRNANFMPDALALSGRVSFVEWQYCRNAARPVHLHTPRWPFG